MSLQKAADSNLEKEIFCPFVKVDVVKREVWGVVTAEEADKDNEVCDYDTTVPYYKEMVDEMSKATDGANIFPLREMHGLSAAGKGIGIEFRKDAKEVYMGFKVVDDVAWKKVEERVYTGFSQGGRYIKRWQDGDNMRYTAKPIEVSLVDVPCLTRAHYDLIRADGSVEMVKFDSLGKKKFETRPLTDRLGKDLSALIRAAACSCACASCKGGNCAGCGAETKCSMTGKAIKYLVSKDNEKHLPYTNEDGKPNRRLMGAAWAALHGGYRGNEYQGPDKEKAIKRLKQLYAQQGLDTPAEKGAKIDDFLKTSLIDVIQNRAYGRLGKGMYTVSRFAQLTEDIKYLWISLEYEREEEGDESPVTDDVREAYSLLLSHFLAYVEEQVEEERKRLSFAV